MPQAKERDRILAQGGLSVGSSGTNIAGLLLGSVNFVSPSLAANTTASVSATVTGMTAAHKIVAVVNSGSNHFGATRAAGSGFYTLMEVVPGANTVTFRVGLTGGSAGAAVSTSATVGMDYIAWT